MSQPTQPAAPPPPARKRRKLLGVLLLAVVLLVIIIIVVSHDNSSSGQYGSPAGASSSQPTVSAPAPAPAAVAPSTATVVYQVTSDASSVSVTYASLKNGGLQESQNNNVTVPWSKTVQADKIGVHGYSLLAQMQPVAMGGTGHDGSSISCKITVDGKVVMENTSTGQYAAVTCAG